MSIGSGIARIIDQAPWKKPEDLVAKRDAQALHDPVHGQALPVFIGTAPIEGKVFWRDGPNIETTTTTTEEIEWVSTPHVFFDGGPLRHTRMVEDIVVTEVTTTQTKASVSFAVAHSFNQFQRPGGLLKVEMNDIVLYDALAGVSLPDGITMRVYDGINNAFDAKMLEKDGAALTPAYHGLRYLFFDEVDLAGFEGAIPASIRILWGDAAEASDVESTIYLQTRATGWTSEDPYWLCYDSTLNDFYLAQPNDGYTGYQIGTTDFATETEATLIEVSGFPEASITNMDNAVALLGTGLIVAQGQSATFKIYDLLLNAGTGAVLDSQESPDGEDVLWSFAQALPVSGRYLLVGKRTAGFSSGRFVTALVDTGAGTITTLAHGTEAIAASPAHMTPGAGEEFYVAGTTSAIYEGVMAGISEPVYTSVYSIPSGDEVQGLFYDASLDVIVASIKRGSAWSLRSINPDDGTVNWSVAVAGDGSNGYIVRPGGGGWHASVDSFGINTTHRLSTGYAVLKWVDGANQPELLVDLQDGSTTQINRGATWEDMDHFDQVGGRAYELNGDHWLTIGSDTVVAGVATLIDELTTFSKYDDDRGGLLTAAQVTTEGLSGITNGGVIIDSDTDLRELASRIAELYGVGKIETATGVKWVLKAKDDDYVPDVVLTEADLAVERRGEAVVKIATRHRNPREVPAEIEVRYISSNADYEPMPARAAWPQGVYDTALSLLKRSLSVPVVLTDQQALELAWGLLARERASDRTHSIKLRPHHLKVEPSDVFELTAGGQTITGMFTKQTLLPDHSLEMTAEGYLSRAATTVTAESQVIHVQPTPSFEIEHIFLDGPLIRPTHDGDGVYLAGYSVLTGLAGWVGGAIYLKRAAETAWSKVAEFAGALPVVGTLTAPLAASPWPFETDTENNLTFEVDYGAAADIAAQTETQFYEAASIIAVGAPGRWNFITWRDVTDNGDGTFTLGTLRQGLKGTEVYEGTSLANDRVVLVKSSHAMLVPYDLGDVGDTVQLKAVATGVHPNAVTAESFTVSGAADTPRAPGNLDATINGSDIDMTWDRRSRLLVDSTGTFGDGTEAPLGADLDVYQVEILDGPGGTVLRTYSDVAGEAKTYPAGDITADLGSIPATLTFTVAQKTSITGIGYGHVAERTVSLS